MGNDGLRAKGSHSLGRWLRGALEKTAGVVRLASRRPCRLRITPVFDPDRMTNNEYRVVCIR